MSPVLVDWLMILVGIVLTAGTAIFVTAEFSLVAADPVQISRRAANGDKRAALVDRVMSQLSLQLSGTQVGITLTTILLGYTTQKAIARLSTDALGHTALSLGVAGAIGSVVALILTNLFSMIFGELIPKNIALADPTRAAEAVVRVQHGFTIVFKPLIVALNGSANWVLRHLGVEVAEELSGVRSAQELAAMVRHSAKEGKLDVSTASLFTRSVHISGLSAKDVMTDRGRVHYLLQTDTAQTLIDKAKETGHSRFPVVGEDGLDDVLGFANLRRAVAVPFEKRQEVVVTSSSLMHEVPRVPEVMELADLLILLREAGEQMALVVDEYGGTSGIVTLEDAIEEIVGEVADEHDKRRAGVNRVDEKSWLVPGVMRPDELLIQNQLELPDEGPYETLGGLIMTELGRIPMRGDEVVVNGCRLRVEQMEGRRIDRVRITLETGGEPDKKAEVNDRE